VRDFRKGGFCCYDFGEMNLQTAGKDRSALHKGKSDLTKGFEAGSLSVFDFEENASFHLNCFNSTGFQKRAEILVQFVLMQIQDLTKVGIGPKVCARWY